MNEPNKQLVIFTRAHSAPFSVSVPFAQKKGKVFDTALRYLRRLKMSVAAAASTMITMAPIAM